MTLDTSESIFSISGTEGMRLTSSTLYTASGINVGIGTSSPTYKLDVQSATSVIQNKSTTGTNASYYIANNTGGDFYIGRDNSTGATFGTNTGYTSVLWSAGLYPMTFHTNGIERLRISDTGNLGLGVTPSANSIAKTFELQTGFNMFGFANLGYINANAYYDGGWKYKSTAAAGRYEVGDAHKWYNAPSWNGTGSDAISFTQAMTLDASGNLGVGTSSPNIGGVNKAITVNSATSTNCSYELSVNNVLQGSLFTGISTSSVALYTVANGPLLFGTNNTERARITSGGRVGIGATNPDAKLTVRGEGTTTSTYSFEAATSGGATRFLVTDGGESNFYKSDNGLSVRITSGGDLLVAKTSASFTTAGAEMRANGQVNSAGTADFWNAYSTTGSAYRFYVTNAGTVFATNTTISAISDQRFKENVSDLDVGLDAVLALKPRKFDWKEGKGKDIKGDRGFIAQEFEQIFPDLVDEWRDPAPEGEEPYKSVRQDLIPVLVKAIQEQQAMIKSLEAKVAALESK